MDPQSAPPQSEETPHSVHEAPDRVGLERAVLLAEAALRLAQRLRQGGLDDIAAEAGSMARANPFAFFGGSILIGLAAARFFKATGERARPARATPF
jgi:hypothetical protein